MICPICQKEKGRLLAISRRDNKTNICDLCACKEALETAPDLIDSEKEEILSFLENHHE